MINLKICKAIYRTLLYLCRYLWQRRKRFGTIGSRR